MRQVLSYLLLQLLHICVCKRFEPTWESLDTHVEPSWYDEGKLGVFYIGGCIRNHHLVWRVLVASGCGNDGWGIMNLMLANT